MLLGMWTTAKQEEVSAKNQQTLDVIKVAVLPDTNSAVQNLSHLSNNQIKQHVSTLAARMRTFEAGLKSTQMRDMAQQLPKGASQQQREADWNAKTATMFSQSAEAQSQFRSQFLPQALALREIMSKRLGILQPCPSDRKTVALDFGMLAGASPVSDAADYLEGLARQLPP